MSEKKSFFSRAFADMKESAKMQYKVDKANFNAVKAESKANFEENRGKNTFKKAKEEAKASWEDAKMSPKERQDKIKKQQKEAIEAANIRREVAEEKLNNLKNK